MTCGHCHYSNVAARCTLTSTKRQHSDYQARRDARRRALFRAIVDGDYEGIVAKRMDAPYRAGPRNTWLKIKNRNYSRRGAVEWQGR